MIRLQRQTGLLKFIALVSLVLAVVTVTAVDAETVPSFPSNQSSQLQSSTLFTDAEKKWLAEHPTITVAYDGYFPPYSFLDDNNQMQGMAVDYVNLIAEKLGVAIKIAPETVWQDIYQTAKLANSPIDVVATMVEKPDRLTYFNFTKPYVFKSLVVFTRNDNTTLLKRKDLPGKKIVLVKDYQYSDRILQEFPTITPFYVPTIRDALEVVSAGKADGAIAYVAVADWYRNKYFMKNIHIAALYERKTANESFAIRKDAPELASILSKMLANLSVQEKKQIAAKWLPKIDENKSYEQVAKQLIIITMIALLLFVLVMYLRKQNKQFKIAKTQLQQSNARLQQLSSSLEQQVQERTTKLFQLSYTDELTQLPNKNAFFKKTEQLLDIALEQQNSLALVSLDIDRFKFINDNLGHKIGDAVIKLVAERIQKHRYDNDIVARFGGDSFNILLANVSNEQALVIIRKLIIALKQPYIVFNEPINISVSAGIAMFPSDGGTITSLLQRSEQALFKAKQEKTGFAFCDPKNISYFSDYLLLEQALLHALNQQQHFAQQAPFQMYYQPIKWLNKKGVKGFESLIRWHDEKLGWVSPQRFIELAEEIGKIDEISHWVRKTAFKQARKWYDEGIEFGRISVNLSPLEFRNPNLIDLLVEEAEFAGARFEWIEIEITETAILKNPTITLDLLHKIKTLGANISIDDFGTGYSSLIYLKEIPADTVKIDREFIKNLPQNDIDIAIDKSIIDLCHAMNKVVVAEGVETEEQLACLTSLGCDSIQGYLIAKAMPASEITKESCFFNSRLKELTTKQSNSST
jgi:diguanylate cyclase (GGDEF)-like protein